MAKLSENKHLQKAFSDEESFLLLARDAAAPQTIVDWIKNSIFTQPADKLHAALDAAIKMADTQPDVVARKEAEAKKDREFRTDIIV
jgi:hypothetical protein